MFVPLFLFVFIAAHAIGQGTVIWVFIAEIFPNHLRAAGQAFGSSTHWVLAAAIPSLVPLLFDRIGAGVVFAGFAGMMVLQLVWVHFSMPETQNIPPRKASANPAAQKKIKPPQTPATDDQAPIFRLLCPPLVKCLSIRTHARNTCSRDPPSSIPFYASGKMDE